MLQINNNGLLSQPATVSQKIQLEISGLILYERIFQMVDFKLLIFFLSKLHTLFDVRNFVDESNHIHIFESKCGARTVV